MHGQTEVTFVYEEVEYTAELTEAWVDETSSRARNSRSCRCSY
ncbi:hypothetical protein [Clostridium cochlearium]|nr:hypothetical protein [Clostridium cochlearium]